MKISEVQIEVMHKLDRIKLWGQGAKDDFKRLCIERGIESSPFAVEYTKAHLEVCEEVYKLWLTTKKFKVGDKVYVVPTDPTVCETCIRATVTEVNDDGWGYHLRAFRSDLPGLFLFNMWDKDLEPRTGKENKPTPPKLLIKSRKK